MNKSVFFVCIMAGCLCSLSTVHAQVTPARSMPPSIGVFAEGSAVELNGSSGRGVYGNFLFGGSAGIYFQARPWFGLEGRATALESHLHQGHSERLRAALGGPRVEWRRGRFTVYGAALAGIGNTDYVFPPPAGASAVSLLSSATAPDVEADAGLDLKLFGRLYWRAFEASYNRLLVDHGPEGPKLSSGFVIKLFR